MSTVVVLEIQGEQSPESKHSAHSYRLVRLTPNDAIASWDFFRLSFERSMPSTVPNNEYTLANLQQAVAAGRLTCWMVFSFGYGEVLKDAKPLLVATTILCEDTMARAKHLCIYSVMGLDNITNELWKECFRVLREYAKEMGCCRIMASTTNKRIVQVAKSLNAKLKVELEMEV